MTRDPALIHALQELAEGALTILLVEDLRRLADELMQQGTTIALLDAQALGVPADAAVDALKNQFPELRLMVAGQATEQNLLATRISDQRVFRFIHKPASPQRLRLFVEAAMSTGLPRRADAAVAAPDAPAPAAAVPPTRGGGSLLPIIAAAAAVLILAVGGWLMMNRKAAEPAALPGPGAATPAAQPALLAMLQKAQQAAAAGNLIAADGSSAAELYREALRLDPAGTAAAEGFRRAIDDAIGGAERALLAGKLDEARSTAELARLIVPDNSRLAFLYTQIERELARVNADASQRQALEARQAQIRNAVNVVAQRLESGALLEPATDSAVSRFREAQSIGGGDPMVRGSRDALVGALLTAADQDLQAGRIAAARRMVEAAGSVNSSAPGLDIMRRRLEEGSTQQAAAPAASASNAAAVAGPVTPATPPAPAPVSTAPAPTPVPQAQPVAGRPAAEAADTAPAATPAVPPAGTGVVSAQSLHAVRKVPAEYPLAALDRLVSGWVEMEFTVGKDGAVQNVVVTESQPGRTFDNAAVAAMKRWRFSPVLRDGQPVEQRASMRMRFTAQDDR